MFKNIDNKIYSLNIINNECIKISSRLNKIAETKEVFICIQLLNRKLNNKELEEPSLDNLKMIYVKLIFLDKDKNEVNIRDDKLSWKYETFYDMNKNHNDSIIDDIANFNSKIFISFYSDTYDSESSIAGGKIINANELPNEVKEIVNSVCKGINYLMVDYQSN